MFDTVNRLLWYVLISNSAEKAISTDKVLSKFLYDRLSPARNILVYIVTERIGSLKVVDVYPHIAGIQV